jgi:hypothetical protein
MLGAGVGLGGAWANYAGTSYVSNGNNKTFQLAGIKYYN